MRMESEVKDVVYLSWLVDIEKAQPYVPPGVRLWQQNGKTIFSILTYQHQHFGPAFLGPLRRWMPSPRQSNWRFYVAATPQQTQCEGVVLFVSVVVDQLAYVLGGRLASDAMPAHLASTFQHAVQPATASNFEVIVTEIHGGTGSAPDLYSDVALATEEQLPEAWQAFFPSWQQAVSYLAVQHSALVQLEPGAGIAQGDIAFPVDMARVQPATATKVHGAFLQHLGIQSAPFCFVIPELAFEVLGERRICHTHANPLQSSL